MLNEGEKPKEPRDLEDEVASDANEDEAALKSREPVGLINRRVAVELLDAAPTQARLLTVSSHGWLGSQPGALAAPVIIPPTTTALV